MRKMRVLPEIKKIAGAVDKIGRLAKQLEEKMDCEGLEWFSACLLSGCKEYNGKLYDEHDFRLDNGGGIVDDLYYCCQHTGYCEDDYYGTIYFKTNVPGQFVAVPFQM